MMKIAQINPCLIPIPPNGWGAIERIIWNYSLSLKKMGHEVDIIDIKSVNLEKYDIIHSHVWNHCYELYERNIPYIFTFHDHHAYVYGKQSKVYEYNLIAMRNSIKSIVPATYLIEYFENIPIYLRHGVDLSFYKQYKHRDSDIKLLCVA